MSDVSYTMKGHLKFEFFNSKTGELERVREETNTITVLGRMLFLAGGPGLQLAPLSGYEKGKLHVSGDMFRAVGQSRMAGNLTLFLLNDNTPLSKDSKVLPIYKEDGKIDFDKIVGFGKDKREVTSPKEGKVSIVDPDNYVQPAVQSMSWRFEEGQAVGTFNRVCLGYASVEDYNVASNDEFQGINIQKGVYEKDPMSNTFNTQGYYMRPGVPGYTSNTEILYSEDSSSPLYHQATHRLNIISGVATALDVGDPAYLIPLGVPSKGQVFYGDDLYYHTELGLYKLDTLTGNTTNIASSAATSLFEIDNMLYYHLGGTQTFFSSYNMDTGVAGANLPFNQQTFPFHLFKTNNALDALGRSGNISKLPDGNFLIVPSTATNRGPRVSIVCSDILDIEGSFIRIEPGLNSSAIYEIGGKNITIGGLVTNPMIDNIQTSSYTVVKSTANTLKTSEGWNGNMVTHRNLDTPETKETEQVMVVSYRIAIEMN